MEVGRQQKTEEGKTPRLQKNGMTTAEMGGLCEDGFSEIRRCNQLFTGHQKLSRMNRKRFSPGYIWKPNALLSCSSTSGTPLEVSPGSSLLMTFIPLLRVPLSAGLVTSPSNKTGVKSANTPLGPSKKTTDVTARRELLAAWMWNCGKNRKT